MSSRGLARFLPTHWLRRRLHLGVHRAIPGLSSGIRTELDRANHELERIFLALGNQFIPLHGKVGGLLTSCEQLIGLASGQREGEPLFQEAVEALHPPLDYISHCVDRHERLLTLLRGCERHTGEMLGLQKQMHDMLAPLTYIEVLFKIESAGLDHEHRDTFLTVAAEIARLRKLVDETFTGNTELLTKTHVSLGEVRRRLEDDFRVHAEQVVEKRRQIESAIIKLDDQLGHGRHQDLSLQQVSRTLAQRIDAIVAGIQRQDIVKQKCDHVVAALAGFEEHGPSPAHFVQLQLKQIQAVDHELGDAIDSAARSIDEIEQQAEEVDRQCVAMVEFEGMTAAADGMVQMLIEALTGVHQIVHETLKLAETSLEATRPAGNIAANLSTTLGELSINMRLIALNAQVRSLQINSGTGLEILAARTASLSGDIADTSQRVADDLGQLKSTANEMFTLLEDFVSRGRALVEVIGTSSGTTEQRLHQLRDRTLGVMTEVGATVAAVRESTRHARATLADAPSARTGIMAAHDRLAEFIVRHKLDHRAKLEAEDAAAFAKHAAAYTMASERAVHDAIVEGREPAPLRDAKESTTELFVDAVSPATVEAPSMVAPPKPVVVPRAAPRPAPVAVRPSPAPAPRAAPPAAAAPPKPAAPTASENFGDNVDLF